MYGCIYGSMYFRCVCGMELKLGMLVGDGPKRINSIFSKRPQQISYVKRGKMLL